MPSELTTYSTAGSFTYTIPEWANYVFMAAMGGGGAGGSSNFAAWGGGGSAGAYASGTMFRGQSGLYFSVPVSVTTLTVLVGAGGVGAAGSNATNGSASAVSAAGVGTLVSGNGGARGCWDCNGAAGTNTSGFTFDASATPPYHQVSQVLPAAFGGRSGQADPANAALGSGGCGGKSNFGYGIGSNGRQGGVWILAYGDRPAFLTMM